MNKILFVTFFTLASSLISVSGHTQTANRSNIVPYISILLLSDPHERNDECIGNIAVGETVLGSLDSNCLSEGRPQPSNAQYYRFSHAGGPIFIDLISGFPLSFNTYLYLREGAGRDGATIDFNEDGHGDFFSSRIARQLNAGTYTIEATSSNAAISVPVGAFILSVYGSVVGAEATGKLNDTGIAVSGSIDANSTICDVAGTFKEQDCMFGRDSDSIVGRDQSANAEDGDDGFSFIKLSTSGTPLIETTTDWSCVKDNVTGLMWEVKTDDGLRGKTHTYTWFNSDPETNGGGVGQSNGGTCPGSVSCDTEKYVNAVNTIGLCGYSDWRLPRVDEQLSLVNYQNSSPAIDLTFFPNTQSTFYWSSTPDAFFSTFSRWVEFGSGNIGNAFKSSAYPVRLVRSSESNQVTSRTTCSNLISTIQPTTPDNRFSINGDDTISDNKTGLMWAQCAQGLTGSDCATGGVNLFKWESALEQAEASILAGHADWRLPNVKELESIIERACRVPAINEKVFPGTPFSPSSSATFWTSSPNVDDPNSAWKVNFLSVGTTSNGPRSDEYPIRLVRSL